MTKVLFLIFRFGRPRRGMGLLHAAKLSRQVAALQTPRRMSMASNAVLPATLGEVVESYDFTAYNIFAVYVAHAKAALKKQP